MVPHTPKYLTSTLPSPGGVELEGGTMRYSGVRLMSVLPTCVIGEDEEEGEQKRSILCTNSLILKVNLTCVHLALFPNH